ncbi:MAG TPA: NRDE family protein [Deltaproteobacteria bacterium]|nr:NRDE family protein [Deltaproteobacteria bacterium]
MCLIVFAYNAHPSYKLVLAANRDEFYERPTAPADFWKDYPKVLAGRDLKDKGTWLGVTREGKFAAITNYRDPASFMFNAPSRGKLVKDFLCGKNNTEKFVEKIRPKGAKYNGYNLILGNADTFFYYSNRKEEKQKITAGIHGLSNHLLDTPWPKVVRGKKMMKEALKNKGAALEESLFALLSDRRFPPPEKLPSTGVDKEWERVLSPVFIKSPNYGTRSSTVLLVGKNRRVTFIERVFDGGDEPWLTSRFNFILDDQ